MLPQTVSTWARNAVRPHRSGRTSVRPHTVGNGEPKVEEQTRGLKAWKSTRKTLIQSAYLAQFVSNGQWPGVNSNMSGNQALQAEGICS